MAHDGCCEFIITLCSGGIGAKLILLIAPVMPSTTCVFQFFLGSSMNSCKFSLTEAATSYKAVTLGQYAFTSPFFIGPVVFAIRV